MVKSARAMASLNAGLSKRFVLHIISVSVVALERMEKIIESPSRLKTSGQQMVAFPIVAASKGTGIMYNIWTGRVCQYARPTRKIQDSFFRKKKCN